MIHPRIARRIALNFLRVQNRSRAGKAAAVAWYDEQFSHVTKEDHDEIRRQLNKLRGKPSGPPEVA